MSEQDKKESAEAEAKEPKTAEELSEEQLETVAGGILIGLNQAIKFDSAVKLAPEVTTDLQLGTNAIKYIK